MMRVRGFMAANLPLVKRMQTSSLTIEGGLPALLLRPERASALLVLAHGAGAGMRHPFLEALAGELAERSVATLRYEFPYLAQERTRPDPPAVLEAAVRAAVARGAEEGLPLLAGGK